MAFATTSRRKAESRILAIALAFTIAISVTTRFVDVGSLVTAPPAACCDCPLQKRQELRKDAFEWVAPVVQLLALSEVSTDKIDDVYSPQLALRHLHQSLHSRPPPSAS